MKYESFINSKGTKAPLTEICLSLTLIVCTPSFYWGLWASYQIFKKGGELDRTLIFIGGCWERGGDLFERGGVATFT